MILVDSSVWIAYFNGSANRQTDMLDEYLGRSPILMGDLILTEVLQGFRSDRDFATAKKLLSDLPFRPLGGFQTAIKSAENYRLLRKSGATVRKTIDVIIATFCINENLPLLHDDRDFATIASCLPLKTL